MLIVRRTPTNATIALKDRNVIRTVYSRSVRTRRSLFAISLFLTITPLFSQQQPENGTPLPEKQTVPPAAETPSTPIENGIPGAGKTGSATQEATGAAAASRQSDSKQSATLYRHQYDERLRFILGSGGAMFEPEILSETGPSWMTNSFLAAAADPNIRPVIPLSEPKSHKGLSFYTQLDYTWKDRITTGLQFYRINRKFRREDPAMVDFFHPEGSYHRWSYFEGVRLTNYREERKNLFIKYLRRMFFRGFKAGLYFSREWYTEENEISFGSYVATTVFSPVAPGTRNWSEGGVAPAIYKLSGFSFGPAFRYQMFDWLGFHSQFTPVSRSGTLTMDGIRLIEQLNDASGARNYAALLPVASAKLKDSGYRFNIEGVIRLYCRYTLHLGILKENFKRSYDGYAAKTFSTGNLPFQEKTPTILGIGELSKAHPFDKIEIYLKLGSSFFF